MQNIRRVLFFSYIKAVYQQAFTEEGACIDAVIASRLFEF